MQLLILFFKSCIYNLNSSDIIADDSLFEQSDEDEIHAAGKHLVGDRERTAYLWGKVGGSYNRAGYELGKEGDVEGIIEDAG